MTQDNKLIGNVQALRAIAAISVVFWHTNYQIFGQHVGYGGVPLFFVISGFIMTHITRSDASCFLSRRFSRVVPIYWLVTAFGVLWFNFGFSNPTYVWPLWAHWLASNPWQIGGWFATQWHAFWTPENSWLLVRSLLFLPSADVPLLGIGWTLNLEIMFYLIFAGCIAVSNRCAPFVAGIILLFLAAISADDSCGSFCRTYGLAHLVFFSLGIGCYYAWRALEEWSRQRPKLIAAVALSALIWWPVCEFLANSSPALKLSVQAILAPALLMTALLLHSSGQKCTNRAILALGASSYALYLTHTFVIEPFRAAGTSLPAIAPSGLVGMAICLALSVALGIATFRLVEIPILRLFRPRGLPASVRPIG